MKPSHGKAGTTEFGIWTGMLTRCYNPRHKSFQGYGSRGIKVCDSWRTSFERFLADVGLRPSLLHSIERMNSDGDYEPGNCRWATALEQSNNRSSNTLVSIGGVTKNLAQWSDEFGVNRGTVYSRYRDGVRGEALFKSRRALITHNGITDSLAGWSRRTGIKMSTIAMRLMKYGWTAERALTEGAAL